MALRENVKMAAALSAAAIFAFASSNRQVCQGTTTACGGAA
jgi:hypothetical protein